MFKAMRSFIVILLFMISCFVQAQDTIVYLAGDRAAVEVVRITPSQIRFKENGRHKDGIYAVSKKRIQSLYYQGEWYVFNKQKYPPKGRVIRPISGKADPLTCRYKVKWNNAWGNTCIMLSQITHNETGETEIVPRFYESIGFDHIHLLSPRVPIYLKTGIGFRYAYPNYFSMAVPTSFGFNFERERVSIMPHIGYIFTVNHMPRMTERVSLSWSTGVDFNFPFHLYLGVNYSVELTPIQRVHEISERLHAFELRVGGSF